MASTDQVDPKLISDITLKERELTGEKRPVKDGPAAEAQKHIGDKIDGQVVADVLKGEKTVSDHPDGPIKDGPAALMQSLATPASADDVPPTPTPSSEQSSTAEVSSATTPVVDADEKKQHTGKMEPATISAIAHAETAITEDPKPVKGGPAAQAQKHAGEPINSGVLHDITQGEKKVTGQTRPIKGGPTAVAQSELSKSSKEAAELN